jgi:phosphoserine phosphatase
MTFMEEIILINITGKDKPGLTASLTGILGQYGAQILDIGQAVIHDYLSLGILIRIPKRSRSSSVLKDLLFAGHELGIDISFSPVPLPDYEAWVEDQGKPRRIITLLGRDLKAGQITQVASVIADHGLNIDVITRLSGRVSLRNPETHPMACIHIAVSGQLNDPAHMRSRLLSISQATGIDISFHLDDIYSRNRRLVVFDMDSTLIRVELIDELAKLKGVGDRVAAITESAMNGEIDFKESLQRRVALLEGLSEKALSRLAQDLPLSEGTERVVTSLKRLGYKIGIISGGFGYFGRRLQEQLGLDYVYANELEIEKGRLTGKVVGTIIDGPEKAAILRRIARRENILLEQAIAVGDGANDLPMLTIAGMGVAFHAKAMVKTRTGKTISKVGLDGLLYLMGISEREIR